MSFLFICQIPKQLLICRIEKRLTSRQRNFHRTLRRKSDQVKQEKNDIVEKRKKVSRAQARRFGEERRREGKGARKLFRYETHRAVYRVKGANFKKPLPRLSVPRCGGIKIQKDESTSSWKLERHRKERAGRRGEERAKSAKKGKCLGLVNFLVICVPPCRFELLF